jgi:ribonuclease P protein component
MGHTKHSFSKQEKLTGKKQIEGLFKGGSSFYLEDLQVKYQEVEGETCNKVLISIPKKLFNRAVDRNLLKRRMREAYRLNKEILLTKSGKQYLYVAFIYLSKNILTFNEIQDQLIRCLERLVIEVENKK